MTPRGGDCGGELNAEQYALGARDEYTINKRTFAFGDLRYLHDKFKGISYLLSPTGGVGYRLVETALTSVAISTGLGGVWEKNPDVAVRASGAVTADEKLSHKLSETATITQAVSALWKTGDFADSLYTFGAGIAANVVSKAQVKVELLDTYKNKPPDPTFKKNDIAVIVAVVYKY